MARNFSKDTDQYFRAVTFDKNGDVYSYYGPYPAAGMASSQGTRNTRSIYYGGQTFKVQRLEAVLRYEEHYSYEGVLIETPVAALEWVDYAKN